jgi:Tfp pilus assembly protein PilE
MKFDRGFTLFEVLIYVGIFAVVFYFIGGFAYNIYMGKDRIAAQQDINNNARFMLNSISDSVEQSSSINGVSN